MQISDAARRKFETLRKRAGEDCIGFLFEGAVGTCRGSSPMLKPVTAPVRDAEEFRDGDVRLYAEGEYADILEQAEFDFDGAIFGRGLTVSWPHREQGCPSCR